MIAKMREINGMEYFMIGEGFCDTVEKPYFFGFILIGNYSNTYKICKDENPSFSGFTLPDGCNGPETEELNKLNFNEIVFEFYREDF